MSEEEEFLLSEGGDSLKQTVQITDDTEDIIPFDHKKHLKIAVLPESLKFAIRYFYLFCCVRDVSGYERKHHSMMVNVSRFIDVHEELYNSIKDYCEKLKKAIEVHAQSSRRGDPHMQDLYYTFRRGWVKTTCHLNRRFQQRG